MGEADQYESLGLDDSMVDERDLDQIIADRRAAEVELDTRDVQVTNRKLPQLLHDQGMLFICLVTSFFLPILAFPLKFPLICQMRLIYMKLSCAYLHVKSFF